MYWSSYMQSWTVACHGTCIPYREQLVLRSTWISVDLYPTVVFLEEHALSFQTFFILHVQSRITLACFRNLEGSQKIGRRGSSLVPLRHRLEGFSFPNHFDILDNKFSVGIATPGVLISESKIW